MCRRNFVAASQGMGGQFAMVAGEAGDSFPCRVECSTQRARCWFDCPRPVLDSRSCAPSCGEERLASRVGHGKARPWPTRIALRHHRH